MSQQRSNPPPALIAPDLSDDFARRATQHSPSLLSEFVQFLAQTRKWWLLPIVLVLLAIGVLVVLSGTALAPFIYTLF
jgi:hypothetical protein